MIDTKAAEALDLGPMDQLGFVVRDLDAAIARYQPLFGPFTVMGATDLGWDYRGRPETSSLRIAFSTENALEIELIEWVAGETPHKEFLDAGHEGMHHLRFRVEDMDEAVQKAAQQGYLPIWRKQFAEGLAATYLEREGDPLILELFENKLG